ncbi:SdpI family protein [Faecalicatena sp. AGMB00832]|uniref:SdpI family protein n=1 Tax=Faecalicatena faecalis TaxID=2726362 RepID=A0ABS6D2N1_9FIRM|nr:MULTISPECIES: SdpI family protein [Faecalicatena]MBU3875590.1 SdpI family protein [Faecalicatena faecalis]MCI6466961.1 SdpI family protein [Faecalicatena sp.]MDY5617669.1 SdpI family protein [Lachnospiraceae bacterium]
MKEEGKYQKYKSQIIITSIITLLPMLVGILLWDKMPDKVAVHWGTDNQPNGWASKSIAVFAMPFLLTIVQVFCVIMTLNDPKKQNISAKMLRVVFWLVPIVSWICCGMTYIWAAGITVNVGMFASLAIGIIFIVVGNYIPKSRQSYTVGIKLPWTLDSTENWNRTSRFAGKLWIAAGLLFIVEGFVQWYGVIPAIIVLLLILPTAYSFILYQKGV